MSRRQTWMGLGQEQERLGGKQEGVVRAAIRDIRISRTRGLESSHRVIAVQMRRVKSGGGQKQGTERRHLPQPVCQPFAQAQTLWPCTRKLAEIGRSETSSRTASERKASLTGRTDDGPANAAENLRPLRGRGSFDRQAVEEEEGRDAIASRMHDAASTGSVDWPALTSTKLEHRMQALCQTRRVRDATVG